MSDVTSCFFPTRHVDPNEPGLACAYTFADGELAVHGRYLNRAATGAAYDLTTRNGVPVVAQGGGILGRFAGLGFWSGAAAVLSNSNFAYTLETEDCIAPGYYLFYTGGVNQHGFISGWGAPAPAGQIGFTTNNLGTVTWTGYSIVGRGPVRLDGLYDGTDQILVSNGREANRSAVVALLPNAGVGVGQGGIARLVKSHNIRRTVEQARASYVREFARKVLWQWQPRDVGEGPAGGVLTGSVSGVGGWTCPLGAATMQFVWRPDLSAPGGGRLCLTDSQTVNLNRIDLEYGSRPWFGSFLVEYQVRDPATDNMVIGFTPRRGVDPTAAASNAYWLHVRTAAGPWWRAGVHLANGAQIDAADAADPGPVAGDRCKVLFSRDVDGTIQVYSYTQSPRGWWWSAAVGNDVTVLPEGCVTIAPRGAFVERVTMFQGAMNAHELEAVLP